MDKLVAIMRRATRKVSNNFEKLFYVCSQLHLLLLQVVIMYEYTASHDKQYCINV